MKLLEVCVDSLESARQAYLGGADRLELCSALAVGGLTPYTALLRQIKTECPLPVRCLMRPRAGDFCYRPHEISLMLRQIEELREAGADGFVIGCLDPEGRLDDGFMKALINACQGCGITLHRCIDVSRDPLETYAAAAELGIDTVLTSGAAVNCAAGMDTIEKLLQLRDQTYGPEVLIGAGVNASVIRTFREKLPQARAFHMSGSRDVESAMIFRRDGVPMGLPGLDEWHIRQTDMTAVQLAKQALNA